MTITELIEALRWIKKDHGDREIQVDISGDPADGRARVVNLRLEDEHLLIETQEPRYGASLDGLS